MLWWLLTLSLATTVQCRIFSTDDKLTIVTVLGGTVTVNLDYSGGVRPIPSCCSNDNLLQQPVMLGSVVTEMDDIETYMLRLHFVDNTLTCHLVPYVRDTDTLSTSLCSRLTCPHGWDLVQDTCFLISQDLLSWTEGQTFCKQKGGSLATISSDVQQEALSRMLTADTWIGLRHQPTINEFKWDDRSAYKYSRWAHGNPQNTPDMEGCVAMSKRYNYLWGTANCHDTKRCMCSVQGLATTPVVQKNKMSVPYPSNTMRVTSAVPTTTTTTPTRSTTTTTVATNLVGQNTKTPLPYLRDTTPLDLSEIIAILRNALSTTTTTTTTTAAPTTTNARTSFNRCPIYWPKFQGNCYRVFEEFVDYATAITRCSAEGAHVVIITSEEEHLFVKGLLRNDAYIGLTDMEVEGTFKWNDGSPLHYTRWLVGEPTDHFGEDCVEMRRSSNYEWNDINCLHVRHFICEKTDQ